MVIAVMQKKAFDKMQHPFMIKIFNVLGMEGNFQNLIKHTYEKSTASILHGERLDAFPQDQEQDTLVLHNSIAMEVVARSGKKKK